MEHINQDELVNRAIGLSADAGYVDVIKLAKLLDINVFFATDESEDFNACIEKDLETKKYNILVNPTQPLERQRFSIAHELAHFVLHKDTLDKKGKLNRDPEDFMTKTEEDKADKLAAEILMPIPILQKYTEEIGLNKKEEIKRDIIEKIAIYFKVSRTVAVIKLRELKFFVPYVSFA